MPTISQFRGITIQMYADEHNPPHFHALYGEYKASLLIGTWQYDEGDLPNRIYNLVVKWASQHENELNQNWGLLREGKPPFKIGGL